MKSRQWSRWLLLATLTFAVGAPATLRASGGDDNNRAPGGDGHGPSGVHERDDEGLHREERQEAHEARDEASHDDHLQGDDHHRTNDDDDKTELRGRTPDNGEAHKSERAREVEHGQQGARMRRQHSHRKPKPTPPDSDAKPEPTAVESPK